MTYRTTPTTPVVELVLAYRQCTTRAQVASDRGRIASDRDVRRSYTAAEAHALTERRTAATELRRRGHTELATALHHEAQALRELRNALDDVAGVADGTDGLPESLTAVQSARAVVATLTFAAFSTTPQEH